MSSSRLGKAAWVCAALLCAAALGMDAQGVQTATLEGVVKSSDGQPLPGVTVAATSAALQGERTTVTDANGGYIFRGLPPGSYKVKFSMSGFAGVERPLTLVLGDTPRLNTTLSVATVEESITVTGEAPSVLNTTVVGANYKGADVDKLATGRTLAAIAEIAPGLTDNTPNAGQVTIAGAFAYDNVFLLNGVDINDNLFGNANSLFIEDAIEETQILTNGISAEFGRFSGGVINAVTKRGGNDFSGSFRVDLTNPTWTKKTPFEVTNNVRLVDKTNKAYQATLGGPLVRDRLWFFVAGRRENLETTETFAVTGLPYQRISENPRYEAKLTGSISQNHTLQASFINNRTEQTQPAFAFSIDPRVLVTRQLPNKLYVVNYNGALSSNLFAEAQFSQKKFGFRNTGGTSTDIKDSPFLARGRAGIATNSHYNAPYFDAGDPEDRDNRQFAGALSYYLSTASSGRHDLKVGFEHYTSTRVGGNSQSATSYVFLVDPVVVGGRPVVDGQGRIVPNFVPGASRLQNWLPVRGAELNLRTVSLYLNDRWALNDHWSFNLGVRYEAISSDATGVQSAADSKSIVPRLGATWDVRGDGKHRLYATYSHYSGKASETQFGDNSNVGTPNLIFGDYIGPAGSGVDFAPGFDPRNYRTVGGSFPVRNVSFDSGLGTPVTKEWTLQYGARLGSRGDLKLIYTQRKTSNFLDEFITIGNGRTTVVENGITFGTFDNQVIRNTDGPKREYSGAQALANYRLTDRWSLSGHYTLQFTNDGTFEGEAANQPGNYSLFGDYPEMYVLARNNPDGRLDDYQKHKVRLWTVYNLGLGRAGDVAVSAFYRYDSARTFSLSAAAQPLSAIQRSRNPGYATPPTTQTVFFGQRGSEFFEDAHGFDFALNYDVPVWKRLRPYFKVELRNAFNSLPIIRFGNINITPVANGPVDADGIPTTFTRSATFGQATRVTSYPAARTFRFAFGFRF